MRTPFLIAVPAFVLGCLVTAGLTTVAHAQADLPRPKRLADAMRWEYKVVSSEADLNNFAAGGWEYVGQSSGASISAAGTINFTTYTMRLRVPMFPAPGHRID